MKVRNVTLISIQTETPVKVFRAGKDLMTIVPQSLELRVPDGRAKVRSFLVGVSSDQGINWTFIDGNIGEDRIRVIVPHLPREMRLPPPQQPVVEKKSAQSRRQRRFWGFGIVPADSRIGTRMLYGASI